MVEVPAEAPASKYSWLKPDPKAEVVPEVAPIEAAPVETAPAEAAPRVALGGGTLFERMSNIARGNAKADHEEGKADPLDIPRFLNRQNNQ